MADSQYILMKLVAPIMGFILANVMFFSGVPGMLRCKRAGTLGDMNPLPFPVIWANCVGWILYSVLIRDYFLFFSNAPGAMVGMYFTLVAYGLSQYKSKTRDSLEVLLMSMMFALLSLTLYVGIVAMDESIEFKKTVVGLFANAVLLIYYAAPLSTLKEVIATRSSRSLYFPLSIANTVNGTAWCVYGLALNDPYLVAPNGVGAFLGAVQRVLIFSFPNKHDTSPVPSSRPSAQNLLDVERGQSLIQDGHAAPTAI